MSKKNKFNEEELKILQNLFGESKKPRISFSGIDDSNKVENFNNEKSNSIEYFGQISENIELRNNFKKETQKLTKLNAKRSQEALTTMNLEKSKRKRKIKKKELLSEVAEILPLIRENNKMLNELIQYYKSIEYSLKTLTQEPIKIKIFK